MKRKTAIGVSKDFSLSIIASVISAGVLQLAVYPLLALTFDASLYGLLLTLMGIINTIGISLGNSLNNTRLILGTEYNKKNYTGDFNLILLFANIVGSISILLIGCILFSLSPIIILLIIILVILIISRSYMVVYFRIKLDFKRLLYNSIFMSIGYLVGAFLGYVLHFWPLAFIIGEIFSIIYLLKLSKFQKETIDKTPLFTITFSKYLILVLTSILANLLLYMDRILIYPILGPGSVATFTTASIIGKSLAIIMGPIAAVLLSYYSKDNFVMTRKKFWSINLLFISGMIIIIPLIYFFAPIFTKFLYPTLFEDAKSLIFIANLAALTGVLSRMIQPAILKYSPTYWLIIKEVGYGAVYLSLGIYLLDKYGLAGLVGTIFLANILKIIFMLMLGDYYVKRGELELE